MYGTIHSYIHPGDQIGVLVELHCETDFVARMPEFKQLAHEIALQIAATDPRYATIEDIPSDEADELKARYHQEALDEGKPESIANNIAEGRFKRYALGVVLLEQTYIRDEEKLVGQLIQEFADTTRETISVVRFVRWEIKDEPRPRQRFMRPPRPNDDDGWQGAPVPKPDSPPHISGRDAVSPSEE